MAFNNQPTNMKDLKKITGAIILLLFVSQAAFAQRTEMKIKTSANCEMCKATIEKALGSEKGIKSASVDLTTKEVLVVYNARKTNPEKIKKAISKAGYDADDVKADNKARAKLKDNCQSVRTPLEKPADNKEGHK